MAVYIAVVDNNGNVLFTQNSPDDLAMTDQQITDNGFRVITLPEPLAMFTMRRFTGGPYPVGKTTVTDVDAEIEDAPGYFYMYDGTGWVDQAPPPFIGEVNTGRGGTNQQGPDDINPSFITFYDGTYAQNELELYVPTTSTLISYDAALPYPYFFDSTGNCFNGTDYEVQIRIVATGQVLGEITVPESASNVVVKFSLYT